METIFWVGVGLGSLIGLIAGILPYKDPIELIDSIFGGTAIGLAIASFIWFVGTPTYSKNETIDYVSNKRGIVAIADGQSTEVSGRFFLGMGSVSGGGTAYWAYEQLEANRYKQITFEPRETTIVEDIDSLSKPYFMEIKRKIKPDVFKKKMEWDQWMRGPYQVYDHVGWEIHIPKGSIVHNFNLDLK